MPSLLLQSLTDFLVLVLCNGHIRSQPLNEHQEQITLIKLERETLILPFGWRGPGAHCVAMETSQWAILRNFVMSITTVKSFSSTQKKYSEIFHFL